MYTVWNKHACHFGTTTTITNYCLSEMNSHLTNFACLCRTVMADLCRKLKYIIEFKLLLTIMLLPLMLLSLGKCLSCDWLFTEKGLPGTQARMTTNDWRYLCRIHNQVQAFVNFIMLLPLMLLSSGQQTTRFWILTQLAVTTEGIWQPSRCGSLGNLGISYTLSISHRQHLSALQNIKSL